MEVTAVTAAPDDIAITGEDPPGINICQQVPIPFFMLFLGYRYRCPGRSYRRESFFLCSCGKPGIEQHMLLMFTICSSQKVLSRCADLTGRKTGCNFQVASFKKFEEAFGMLLFLIGCFLKNIGNLNKAC